MIINKEDAMMFRKKMLVFLIAVLAVLMVANIAPGGPARGF